MHQQHQRLPQQQPLQHKPNVAALGLSCISAAVAEAATYPIDAVKTQLQLQRNKAGASSRRTYGAVHMARQLVHSHGLSGLYAGLSPAVLRHLFYSGTRITLYEHLRSWYAASQAQQGQIGGYSQTGSDGSSSSSSSSSTSSSGGQAAAAGLLPKLAFGLTAGGVGQLVAVPADVIKVQMQADVREVMAGRRQYRQFSSMYSVAAALVHQQGIRGLWRGGLPAVQRAALVNLGELSTYDSAKQAISQSGVLPAGLPVHVAASLCSGLVSAIISTPTDVIKTRLMAQQVAPSTAPLTAAAGAGAGGVVGAGAAAAIASALHYRGMVDCAVQTVRSEGVTALYKGFLPTWARLGPWQLVFWVAYEQLRAAASISNF